MMYKLKCPMRKNCKVERKKWRYWQKSKDCLGFSQCWQEKQNKIKEMKGNDE